MVLYVHCCHNSFYMIVSICIEIYGYLNFEHLIFSYCSFCVMEVLTFLNPVVTGRNTCVLTNVS